MVNNSSTKEDLIKFLCILLAVLRGCIFGYFCLVFLDHSPMLIALNQKHKIPYLPKNNRGFHEINLFYFVAPPSGVHSIYLRSKSFVYDSKGLPLHATGDLVLFSTWLFQKSLNKQKHIVLNIVS